MDPALFKSYPGYASLSDVVRTFKDGRSIIKTPQVLREVKAHLGCERLLGAELEDDGKLGTRGTHWEQRVFEVRAVCVLCVLSCAFVSTGGGAAGCAPRAS